MTRMESQQISGLVEDVSTWNPSRDEPTKTFRYIDLSAIDQERKVIVGAQETKCADAPSRARQVVMKNDVLVSTVRPNLNGVAKVPADLDSATASTGFCVLRPRPSVLCSDYLFHWVQSSQFVAEMVKNSTGANYPAVSNKIVTASRLPYVPLPEQRRIAAILDQADALRAKRREALAQLDSLTQSIFIEMFGDPVTNPKGWPEVAFPDVVYFQEGPGVRKWQFRDSGIKLINVGNIVDGQLVLSRTSRHLDAKEVNQRYRHFLLDEGDLVVASSGVTWGKIAYVTSENLPLCLNTSVIRLRALTDSVSHEFIRTFVASAAFRGQISKLITGSAQPNFGPAHLKQVRMMLPPSALQKKFSEVIVAASRHRTKFEVSINKLDALFASLQHRAFRGEL